MHDPSFSKAEVLGLLQREFERYGRVGLANHDAVTLLALEHGLEAYKVADLLGVEWPNITFVPEFVPV